MSSGRLQLFRHAFNRAAPDFQMVEVPPEAKPHDAKKAVAHWRQLLDKVFLLQTLIGLEDSVNLWLPQESTEAPSSPLSSKQLAEVIKDAELIAPMRAQVPPVKMRDQCPHVAERLATGANQHAGWIVCWDCHARWKVDKSLVVPKVKKEKPKSKASAQMPALPHVSTPASSADLFQEEMRARTMAHQKKEQIYQEHVASLQQLTTAGQDEVRNLRAELEMVAKEKKIQEIMMSEYGAMAMGAHYAENQSYHDSEMFIYAEKRLENQLEIQAMTQLQGELSNVHDADMRGSASASRTVPRAANQSGQVWKEHVKGSREKTASRSPSLSRKRG